MHPESTTPTPQGLILIKSELRRLRHAVAVGEANGLFIDELSLDVQLLLAGLQD
jgi:hypothetical protein